MSASNVEQATEAVYHSLANDNQDIDLHIDNLRSALAAEGKKEAVIDPARLVQNNRSGRKLMQSYFKRRGVKIVFAD